MRPLRFVISRATVNRRNVGTDLSRPPGISVAKQDVINRSLYNRTTFPFYMTFALFYTFLGKGFATGHRQKMVLSYHQIKFHA